MNDGCFVRCFWGEDSYPVRDGILRDLDKCLSCKIQLDTRWYAYGTNNYRELEKRGVRSVLLDEQPIPRFGRDGDRKPIHNATINWGVSFWYSKYPPLLNALQTHPDCIWLDLDTLPVRPLPDDFWTQCRARLASFACALRQGSQRRCHWRGEEHVRKTPLGSLMYFRGRETVERFLQVYDTMPHVWDLIALAKFCDELDGGFWGAERYKELRHEPWFHTVTDRGQIFRPPQEDVLFHSGKKPGFRDLGINKNWK